MHFFKFDKLINKPMKNWDYNKDNTNIFSDIKKEDILQTFKKSEKFLFHIFNTITDSGLLNSL